MNQPRIQGSAARTSDARLSNRNQNRSTLPARHGAVATSQTLASYEGLRVLQEGGNAIDAAIAANAMLALTEPFSCGPGGDLFAIVWSERDQKLHGLNASGRSLYAWTIDRAKKSGAGDFLPVYGPLAWSVPGCVSGWKALHGRFGHLDWARLFEPAAGHAREGFLVTELIGHDWQSAPRLFEQYPNAAATYAPDGSAPRFGQVFRNPDLASVFEILMQEGADAYYQGEIAERIVKYSKERGGMFEMSDFTDHHADWVDPVSTSYRGYDLWEIPPNGQGAAALQIMNMLETFDIGSLEPNSAEHLHLFIEAKKLAFEDRAVYYADMDKAEVPLEWLISKDYGRERAQLIDPKRAALDVKPGIWDGSHDTVYLCAADDEGNMISLIQSIYYGWGSREVPTGLGFCLQNRGSSFNLNPNHRNALEPHKRPFHTIIPAFLTQNGKPRCAFGVMGGDFQPQGHAQVLMNMIDFGLSMQQAGDQPRVRHFGSSEPTGEAMNNGGKVGLEAGFSEETKQKLTEMGHDVAEFGVGRHGGYQAIWRDEEPRRYFAGSDPRKDGAAFGF
ncbi:MAG: gamma-glutamyltransferase [bacterium]|nr:gamma-glutamyltransferase [bacterium]